MESKRIITANRVVPVNDRPGVQQKRLPAPQPPMAPGSARAILPAAIYKIESSELPWYSRLSNWFSSFFGFADHTAELNKAANDASKALHTVNLFMRPGYGEEELPGFETKLDTAYQELTQKLDYFAKERRNISNKEVVKLEKKLLETKLTVQAMTGVIPPLTADPKQVLQYYTASVAAVFSQKEIDANLLVSLKDFERGEVLARQPDKYYSRSQILAVRRYLENSREFQYVRAAFEKKFPKLLKKAIGEKRAAKYEKSKKILAKMSKGEAEIREHAFLRREAAIAMAKKNDEQLWELIKSYAKRGDQEFNRELGELRKVVRSGYSNVLFDESLLTEDRVLKFLATERKRVDSLLVAKQFKPEFAYHKAKTQAGIRKATENLKLERSRLKAQRKTALVTSEQIKLQEARVLKAHARRDIARILDQNIEEFAQHSVDEIQFGLRARALLLFRITRKKRHLELLKTLLPKAVHYQFELITNHWKDPDARDHQLVVLIKSQSAWEVKRYKMEGEFDQFYRQLYHLQAQGKLSPLRLLTMYEGKFGAAYVGQKGSTWRREKKVMDGLMSPMFTEALERHVSQEVNDAWLVYTKPKGLMQAGHKEAAEFYDIVVCWDRKIVMTLKTLDPLYLDRLAKDQLETFNVVSRKVIAPVLLHHVIQASAT